MRRFITSKSNRLSLLFALATFALTMLVNSFTPVYAGPVGPYPPTPTPPQRPQTGESQLRVQIERCYKIWRSAGGGRGYWEYNCYRSNYLQIEKVEGVNQYRQSAVWNYYNYPCGMDGSNVFLIRNWWWKFDRGVKITLLGDVDGTGRVFTAKTSGPLYSSWGVVTIRINYVKSAIPITIRSGPPQVFVSRG